MKLFGQIPKARIVFLAVTALMLNLIGLLIVTSRPAVQADPLVIATSVFNICLFTIQLIRAVHRHPFSFDFIFWLFSLFFFGYVPLLQHMTNSYAWDLTPKVSEVCRANIYVLLWSVCYIFGRDGWIWFPGRLGSWFGKRYRAFRGVCGRWAEKCILNPLRKLQQRTAAKVQAAMDAEKGHYRERKTLKHRIRRAWWSYRGRDAKAKCMDILLFTAIGATLFDLITVGFSGQLSRDTASLASGNTMVDLLLNHGMNNFLMFTATLHILVAKERRRLDLRTVVAVLCFVTACFPTGLARNMMASFYAGMFILTIDQTRKGRWFSWLIIGGLVLVFPALEVFRWLFLWEDQNVLELILEGIQNTYSGGHYDAHQMIISIERYTTLCGFSWGKQALGALLFFVPRAIWPGKPTGTGHTAIVALDQFYFSNVSAPLVAEGFVNFGEIGIILFALIVGMVTRRLDDRYWNGNKKVDLLNILYPFAMFMFFFLLRGDMLSAGAYIIAQCVVGSLVYGVYKCAVILSNETK